MERFSPAVVKEAIALGVYHGRTKGRSAPAPYKDTHPLFMPWWRGLCQGFIRRHLSANQIIEIVKPKLRGRWL